MFLLRSSFKDSTVTVTGHWTSGGRGSAWLLPSYKQFLPLYNLFPCSKLVDAVLCITSDRNWMECS